jgi:hypothetical protein
MTRWVILIAAVSTAVFAASVSFPCHALALQDSASSPSPEQQAPLIAPSSAEPKKAKKVWTNDNLGAVSASPISQVGDAKDNSSGKKAAAKPATSQEVAAFRKQLASLQIQLASVEKQVADLTNFSKGETSGANGFQLHKRYTTEPIDAQVRKLEEKRKLLAAQMDTVLDAARKHGIEPGQLR